MKKFKLFILSLLPLLAGAQMAMADIKGAPYIPEIDCRFNALEQGQTLASGCSGFPIGSADGHYVKQVAKATYDFSKKGGAVGSIPLGVTIPANAIETRSYLYSITQPTTSASGTLDPALMALSRERRVISRWLGAPPARSTRRLRRAL